MPADLILRPKWPSPSHYATCNPLAGSQISTSSDILRTAGLRRTPARLTVLDAVHAIGHPATHAQLAAHPPLAGMDPVTLYRTLSTLEDAGLVHRVPGIDGAWRTCPQPTTAAGCPGNHAHFYCTRCAAMRCMTSQPIPKVTPPEGATITGRHMLATGLCSSCAGAPSP